MDHHLTARAVRGCAQGACGARAAARLAAGTRPAAGARQAGLTGALPRPDPALRHGEPGSGELVVAGAHGGAGTTTLALLLRPAWDVGVIWHPGQECPQVRIGGRPLVLAAGNTAAGAARAAATVSALAAQGVRVAVLAVAGDGLPDPESAAYRFRLLGARVGAVVRVPFLPALRAVDDPALADLPRRARRALAAIRAQALAPAGWPLPRTL